MPPPRLDELVAKLQEGNQDRLIELLTKGTKVNPTGEPYLPWDKLRYKRPPEGLTLDEWWLTTRLSRNAIQRPLPFRDKDGRSFSYALPDVLLRTIEEINRSASGTITISEQVTNPSTRDRYLVNSLIEEAIMSSQLEGASTERGVAKEMLRTGRLPRDRDERMIVNNYAAMRRIRELKDESLTLELICEIQRIVTDGTLDNPDSSGRLQLPADERVAVYSVDNELLHKPPMASELPVRMQRLCDFANGKDENFYIPPVVRAIVVHFMLGYDHPFEDGNGRTARTLFYWSMLNQGYWLTEFLTISRILKKAPAQYARSFLYSEHDYNDLTYFIIYQADVICRSIRELHLYLERKMNEVRGLQQSLAMIPGEFNHRQLALLENAIRNHGQVYTTNSHATSHNVTIETARQDLTSLEGRGLLSRTKRGRAYAWIPVSDIADRLRRTR